MSMMVNSFYLQFLLLVSTVCILVEGQNFPVFVRSMHNLLLKEDLPVGSVFYTVSAYDPDGGKVTYSRKADWFTIDENTGVCELSRPLDYEKEVRLTGILLAIDDEGLPTSVSLRVAVDDTNDEKPYFDRTTYSLTVPEDLEVNNPIVSNLKVVDKDFTNTATLQVVCNASAADTSDPVYKESCETFQPVKTEASNRNWDGYLKLVRPLDFESRYSYQVPLQIYDGKFYVKQSFEITVTDVNDTPPRFVHAQDAVINEGLPPNSPVEYVSAVDGDKTKPNNIRYELYCNPSNMFQIDANTGNITNRVVLDRETKIWEKGFLDLCIRAREVIKVPNVGERLGNNNLTTATATIQVTLRDVNDNEPRFDRSNYIVSIREDIPTGSALPLIMNVTDGDSGTAKNFKLVLLNHNDAFSVFPESRKGQATGSILVKDTNLIDYDRGTRQYILRVESRETFTNPALTGSTTVTVNVLDVNDNIPQFIQPSHQGSVREDAPGGTSIITITAIDPDSGKMGKDGIVFELVGFGAQLFRMDRKTGFVSVAQCSTPGSGNCINFEAQKQYDLTVKATDEEGKGRSQTSQLIIDITDVNDNSPRFGQQQYVAYILEGSTVTVNPLIAKANDVDPYPNPQLRYSLAGTPKETSFWQIGATSASITAINPIRFEDTPDNKGEFNFNVVVTDGTYRQTVPVKIYVIDINDNVPICQPSDYVQTIAESTRGDVSVEEVTCTDQDSPTSDNGKIEYGIETGGQGKFRVNRTSGEIFTTKDATFDYDQKNVYKLVVLARDGGNPQKTGTATVTVNIRDANNKWPYFTPTTQRASISEVVQVGSHVTFLKAKDPDAGTILNYYFVQPIRAITPEGVNVDPSKYDITNLFRVEETTGRVRTNNKLDRDQASVITITAHVVDTTASPRQTGTGTLIIYVLEFNDQAPQFPDAPYRFTINEELQIGTFLRTFVAQDEDDTIDRYVLVDNPGQLFAVSAQTGVLTVNNRIDYEKINETQITLQAFDNGRPQLDNKTVVRIDIRNINDNSPLFSETAFVRNVPEHSNGSTNLLTVTATDSDRGDYGVVRYRLDPGEKMFVIDRETGVLSIAPNVILDREKQSSITTLVTAYDSPLDATVRRKNTVPVYINLDDINDHPPVFSKAEYKKTIIEIIDLDAEIIQLDASDLDIGKNALIAFTKVPGSGDQFDYFKLGRKSGRISVGKNLRGKAGVYPFIVQATDRDGDSEGNIATAKVIITVLSATNSPPKWMIPPRENMTIDVLESQYLGMFVYDVLAVDNDGGANGVVDYGFYMGNEYTTKTPEFRINSITGVIRAEIVYDREQVSRYVLTLSARDRGDPPIESIRFLTVDILDVDDNVPKFSMSNGESVPYDLSVKETDSVGTIVGVVRATDDDTFKYSRIYYYIIAGNQDNTFSCDVTTGNITLNKKIDREKQSAFSLDVLATNNISDDSVIRNRRKRSTDPSIVTVRISVQDANDEVPKFVGFNGPRPGVNEYYGCISTSAAYGKSIVQVKAIDADSAGPAGIRYSIISGNDGNTFSIDEVTGIISNRVLLDAGISKVFSLLVAASDGVVRKDPVTANVIIFVTTSGNEAKLVLNQRSSSVQNFIAQLIRVLHKSLQYVCVSRVEDHTLPDGTVSLTQTDVFVTAGVATDQGGFTIYKTGKLIELLTGAQQADKKTYDSLYIMAIGAEEEASKSFIERTPVLAVLIIIILLVILALILFCLACYCIRDSKRKKIRKTNAERHTVVQHDPVEVKNVNPVYDNRAFVINEPEDEYAVVQKKKVPQVLPVVMPDPEPEPVPVIVDTLEAESVILPQSDPEVEPDEGPVPVVETIVMTDDEPVIIETIPEQDPLPEPEPEPVRYVESAPVSVLIPAEEPDQIEVEIDDESPKSSHQSTPHHTPPPSTSMDFDEDDFKIETDLM